MRSCSSKSVWTQPGTVAASSRPLMCVGGYVGMIGGDQSPVRQVVASYGYFETVNLS